MTKAIMLRVGQRIRPLVTPHNVKVILDELYGLKLKNLRELNGYDDVNYYVTVTNNDNPCDGSRCEDAYVFKVMNLLDSKEPDVLDAQTCLLLHLGDNGVNCSKPVPCREGNYYTLQNFEGGEHMVRLFEFIDGTILHSISCTPSIFYEVGKFVAQLDKTLQNFGHSAFEGRTTLWMLKSVPKLFEYMYAVDTEERKLLVQDVIKHFVDRVQPVAESLETGIIHGDCNEQNIIMERIDDEWKIKAVIDFGDSQKGCYLYELAITMTYMILQGGDPEIGGYVLGGYNTVRRLPEKEFKLLKVCIAARLCQSLVLGAYSNLQDPTNSYLLTTATRGWKILDQLWRKDEELLLQEWKDLSENFAWQKEIDL